MFLNGFTDHQTQEEEEEEETCGRGWRWMETDRGYVQNRIL